MEKGRRQNGSDADSIMYGAQKGSDSDGDASGSGFRSTPEVGSNAPAIPATTRRNHASSPTRPDGKIELQENDCYEKLGFSFSDFKKWTILSVIFVSSPRVDMVSLFGCSMLIVIGYSNFYVSLLLPPPGRRCKPFCCNASSVTSRCLISVRTATNSGSGTSTPVSTATPSLG